MHLVLRLSLIALGIGGWAVAAILALILYGAIYKPWDDEISLAARHTRELLALHEKYDQTRPIVDWLVTYHGEAAGHQVMISFVEWSLDHRAAAEAILSSEISGPAALAQRLAFAASDSGLRCEFLNTLAKSAVPLIGSATTELSSGDMQECISVDQ